MAHFAELDKNNTVLRVIVVGNNDMLDPITGEENESIGISFLQSLFGIDTKWVQTSYNGNFRGRYAATGFIYDSELDIFVDPAETNITEEE